MVAESIIRTPHEKAHVIEPAAQFENVGSSKTRGMVVADSFLNAVKSQVRRSHQLEGLDLGS